MSEPTGHELWRRNIRRSTVAMLASNALAAVMVFLYLALVVPVPSVAHPTRVTVLNLVVFALYLAVAFPIAWVCAAGIASLRLVSRLPLGTTSDYRAGMLVQHAVACVGYASEPWRRDCPSVRVAPCQSLFATHRLR